VTVTQHHNTNTNVGADEIHADSGPCQPLTDGETSQQIGEGWAYDNPSLRLTDVNEDQFTVAAFADPNGTTGAHLTAFVTCLKPADVPLDVTAGEGGGDVPSDTTGSFEGACVVGVPISGEFIIQQGFGYVETFQRTEHTWLVRAHAVGGPMSIDVKVLCERSRFVPAAQQPYSGVVVPPGTSASTSVTCPAGSVLTDGGFDVPDGQGVIVMQNSPAAASDPSPGPVSSWRVSGVNIDHIDHVLYARAVCMTVDAVDHAVATYVPAIPTPTI
jgi:hypothetical protein